MYPINTKHKCNIYNSSFLNDLKDHTIEETLYDTRTQSTSPRVYLSYKNSGAFSDIHFKITEMRSFLSTHTPVPNTNSYNWLPAIVSHDNYVQNKEILAGNVVGNKVLGIENFITVQKPIFKHWSVVDNNDVLATDGSSISVDWFINSNIAAIEPEYGVLYWYKQNDPLSTNTTQYSLKDLPKLTVVSPTENIISNDGNNTTLATTSDKLIKLDNNTLKFLDKSPVDWNNGPTFNYGTKDTDNLLRSTIDISTAKNTNNIKFYATYSQNFLNNAQTLLFPDYQIWVSDGEFYSYYNNSREKSDFRTNRRIPSRSYLSPGLYHIYRAIYNAFTVDRIRNSTTIGTVCYNEKLKKLCSILATSPLIDRVTINCLYNEDIRTNINTYLATTAPTTINEEIRELVNIINTITVKLNNLTNKIDNQNSKNNYIRTPSQLYKKLITKYAANLRIENNQIRKVKMSTLLPNGPHAYFDINHKTFCAKTAIPSTDRVKSYIYNNFEYKVGDITIKNSIDKTDNTIRSQSLRIFSDRNPAQRIDIPWDISIEPKSEKLRVNLGKDIVLPFTPDSNGEMKINYDLSLPEDVDVFWQLIDGPECFRFSNYAQNGRIDFLKRNKISYDSRPDFYIKKPGLYTLQCQVTKSSILKASDYIRVYIGSADTSVPPRTTEDSNDFIVQKYNAICSNLRQFALNKNGLIWIVDSDIYNIAQTNQQVITDSTSSSRLLNRKIGLGFLAQVANNAEFSIKFDTLNTVVKLHSVSIENMRDGTPDTAQCKSFYQDKIVRQRDRVGTIINTFVARYFRQDRDPDSITFYGRGYDENGKEREFRQEYNFPAVSTILGPDVFSYGGYANTVINQIGVEIPFHPVYEGSTSRRLSIKKLPNGFWGDGANPSNPIVSNNPMVMDRLLIRNYMGGDNPKIRCNMMDIPINGYVTLNKGYFHPNSGWYPASTSTTYPSIVNNLGSSAYSSLSSYGANITSVHRYKLARYKSLYFTGNGMFDMRGMTVGTNTSYNTYMSRILLKNGSDTGAYFNEHAWFHGYRNINGISYKAQEYIDDLYLERCTDNETEDSFICDPIINSSISSNCYPGIATTMYSFPPNILNNLTIQDLELKINFINYPNPKNMILALEIFNDTLPALPDFNKLFISNNKESTGIPDLDTYLSKIAENNANTSSSSRTIYLYNQESLDNYNYNFSLLFSDHHHHEAVFDDQNKYDTYISSNNDPIYSSIPVGPTLSTNTYSDKTSAKYKKAIKNNFVPVKSASLAQFKNIPLLNTSFILKVIILGQEEKVLSMDNVVNNSELSGLSSFELARTSNTIANSICSWDLIVHTTKTPKFNNKNPRGHIDYNNDTNSVIYGHNFIGDFTDKTYLIPKVNMNAPYEYLANINYYCRYINDDELSRPLSYQEIKFPFVFYSFTPFFTLVGAMFAAWELQQAFSRGGRSDPIISMLYDIRFQRMQEELERNYFQPGYEAVAQGYADKAVVSLSKDNITWYKMEVPINRYEHSDILRLKRYNYLKLTPEVAKPLSLFKFDVVAEDKNLAGSGEIKYKFDTNILRVGLEQTVPDPTNSDLTITLKFDEGDIVELASQTTATDNGLYVIKSGAWVRFPDTKNIKFLINNKYYNNDNTNNITSANITGKQIIKIKGSRAANFFDINESVSLSSNTDRENPITRTITDKYIINITNSSYTVLVLNSPVTTLSSGYLYKNTNNVLLIYSDTETIGDDSSIGKWGLSKSTDELGSRVATKISHSAMGEGNYGYGTPYVDPDVYASLSYDTNNLDQVYNILNNHVNDRYKYNKIFIESNGSTTTIDFDPDVDSPNSLCKAYPFSINDYGYAKDTAGYEEFFSEDISEADKTNVIIDMVGGILQKDRQNYYFMDLKSDKFASVPASGYLYIENDYVKYKPTQKLSETQKKSIQDRIDFISVTGVPSNILPTASISVIDNIPDLITVYNSSSEATDVCQYPNFNNTSSDCKKQQAKLKLISLSDERAGLLKILENDSRASPNVLPIQEIVFKTIPQTGQAGVPPKVIIEYKTKDYFWFNIDANQTCSITDEAMPRILYETEYSCSPIVEYYQYPECDSVCSYTTANGADFEFKSSGGGTICINKKVEEEKQQYPQVAEWGKDIETGHEPVTKKFFLSCEDNMRDTLLTVKERYLYPKIANLVRSGLVKDIFNLDSTDNIKMKFRIIPRKLKTIDPIYQRYVYDYNGNLGKDLIPAPGGPMYNGLSVWRCIDTDSTSANYGKMIDPPIFFKLQNEMIFRAYFGSVDGIEIKNSPIAEAKEFWEWIPYEYFDGPVIE
jgi:hypothetical protein